MEPCRVPSFQDAHSQSACGCATAASPSPAHAFAFDPVGQHLFSPLVFLVFLFATSRTVRRAAAAMREIRGTDPARWVELGLVRDVEAPVPERVRGGWPRLELSPAERRVLTAIAGALRASFHPVEGRLGRPGAGGTVSAVRP